jgi:alkaline phosphatase D
MNLLLNTLLLLGVVDFVVQPLFDSASDVTFTRVGAVYPDSAKIVVRYPEFNATEHRVRIVWREARSSYDKWRNGPVLKLNDESDWVNTGLLSGLWPSTDYECK